MAEQLGGVLEREAGEDVARDGLDTMVVCPECHGEPNYWSMTPGSVAEMTPDEYDPCLTCRGLGYTTQARAREFYRQKRMDYQKTYGEGSTGIHTLESEHCRLAMEA